MNSFCFSICSCCCSIGSLLRQLLQLALRDERRVIARIALEPALGKPDDSCREAIQQIAVMADQNDRPAELQQVFLQPFDRRQIQVIGRLVEQQQVRLADQQLGQRQPRPLSAGQRLDDLLPGLAAQPDAQQRRFESVPPGVSAGQVEIVLGVLILPKNLCPAPRRLGRPSHARARAVDAKAACSSAKASSASSSTVVRPARRPDPA